MKRSASLAATRYIALGLLLQASSVVWAGQPSSKSPAAVLHVVTDRADAMYKCGEEAAFRVSLTRDGKPIQGASGQATLTLDGGKRLGSFKLSLADGPFICEGTLKEPGVLQCAVVCKVGEQTYRAYAAAAFEPLRIKATAVMPDDFDAFWEAGRKELADIPLDVRLTPLPDYSNPRQDSFKISFANVDHTRIYGFLSVPKKRPAPYPAYVTVSSAGLGKPRAPSGGYAAQGILTLSMGVHDHDLLLPREEYAKLGQGRLKGYYRQGAPDRERYYFRRAILGIDRAVTWLAQRPDYDGKHMVYYGSSQGGGFGLILAGLNPHITAMAGNVPALCDHGGYLVGRSPGWPRLALTFDPPERAACLKMSAYFDAVNFARRIRCPVLLSVGLIDRTCSPSSVYAAFNEIQTPKRIIHGPLTGHGTPPDFGPYLNRWRSGQLGRAPVIPPAHGEPTKE